MHALSMHYWLSDGDGRLLDVDPALAELLGYPPMELVKLTVNDIEIGLTLEPMPAVHRRLADYRRRDGSLLPMKCCTRYSPGQDGQYFTVVEQLAGGGEPQQGTESSLLQLVVDWQQSSQHVVYKNNPHPESH